MIFRSVIDIDIAIKIVMKMREKENNFVCEAFRNVYLWEAKSFYKVVRRACIVSSILLTKSFAKSLIE